MRRQYFGSYDTDEVGWMSYIIEDYYYHAYTSFNWPTPLLCMHHKQGLYHDLSLRPPLALVLTTKMNGFV